MIRPDLHQVTLEDAPEGVRTRPVGRAGPGGAPRGQALGRAPRSPSSEAPTKLAGGGGLLERAVRQRLKKLIHGSLTLKTADGVETYGCGENDPGAAEGAPHGFATVHDERFWPALALRGSVGAGEAYAHGWWSTPEPTEVVRVFVANQAALQGMERGLARLSLPLLKAFHAIRENTKRGAQKNIAAHYDLSNEFFGLFLDPTMTYSSAVFETPEMTLEEAQIAKIDRLCERLDLGPDDHLLEIGTGWGAFAMRAASKFGCRVTTTTISKQQFAYSRERIQRAGLAHRIDVRLEDYRDLTGTFTKAVSVEMIEAVGARNYGRYFDSVARLLEPGGAFAIQAITIHDRHFDRARRAVDFIQRHIFPGSCIPSVTSLTTAARDASDLRLVHMEDLGEHYAPTLRMWRETLRARRSEAQAIGFDDVFLRLFDFYFAYCEGGFIERHISVAHLVFAREGRAFSRPLPLESSIESEGSAPHQRALGDRTSRRETRWKIANFVIFQLVYTACVLGARHGAPWIGPLAGLCLLPLNLLFATRPRVELRIWCIAGVVGATVDSALMHAGLIGFPEGTRMFPGSVVGAALVPAWIAMLWISVGTMIRSSLSWLGRFPRGIFVVSAISGPLSFWSGSRLGVTELPRGALSLSALALEYAVLVPFLFHVSRRAERAA